MLTRASALGFARFGLAAAERKSMPNVLLITADDMGFSTVGVTGYKALNVTPNIDKLANQGIRFEHAHVTAAVCQPCRQTLMTGRYPHRTGSLGFEPINKDVPTLQESLRAAGYMNGIMSKEYHLAPIEKFCWDMVVSAKDLGMGRDPRLYYEHAREFFERAKSSGKPFYLMANSDDPHRPFSGSRQEQAAIKAQRITKPAAEASRRYTPEEVQLPPFLPDLPAVRKELADYYTSSRRCDDTVGAVLRALDESGLAENTLVMFLSDHGMPFPSAKAHCYPQSTRTPWIVRWPGNIQPSMVDTKHFVAGIDYMPTILDALGLPSVEGMDGCSFLPVLLGKEQSGRDKVFTHFNKVHAGTFYPTRCVQDKRFCYIFNAWSDGKLENRSDAHSGLTFRAMINAAKTDKDMAKRVEFLRYRIPEEYYDLRTDPYALNNLVNDKEYQEEIHGARKFLREHMESTGDLVLELFDKHLAAAASPLED